MQMDIENVDDVAPSSLDDSELITIVTTDAGGAFRREVDPVLRMAESARTAHTWDASYYKKWITTLEEVIRLLVTRMELGLNTVPPISPFIGRMHIKYSQSVIDVYSSLHKVAEFAKTQNIALSYKFLHYADKAVELIDNYPLHTIIVPAVIPGFVPRIRNPPGEDRDAEEYREWRARMPRGIRTAEDSPWAPTREEVGCTFFIPYLATVTTQSMLDEFAAVAQDNTCLPFKVSGYPVLQEVDPTSVRMVESTLQDSEPDEIPVLEWTIPPSELPDVLLVSDPDGVTRVRSEGEACPLVYRRIDPIPLKSSYAAPPERPESERRTARLHLSRNKQLGSGHSAHVYSAVIELTASPTENAENSELSPEDEDNDEMETDRSEVPFLSRFPPKLAVGCKIPDDESADLDFVLTEACIYNQFPLYLSQTYNGFLVVPKETVPTPADAVVPKFYGYYVPDESNEDSESPRPLLLMEQCGKPIAVRNEEVSNLPQADRELLFSHIRRLHRAGFTQNSFSPRNILVQPGPMNVPRSERSMNHPSYRIIDFGRGENQRFLFKTDYKPPAMTLQMNCANELAQARKLFGFDPSRF